MTEQQTEQLALTRVDLLQPGHERHREAWDRMREVCLGYGVPTPAWRDLVAANSDSLDGDVRNGIGAGWFESLGLSATERQQLLEVNQSLVLVPAGGILNIDGGCFIELPDGSKLLEG